MPDRLTFTPIYEGAALFDAQLGGVVVGRTIEVGSTGRWICWLPMSGGASLSSWKDEKSPQAARNAISARVADWLRLAGVA